MTYEKQIATANRLIKEKGEVVTWRQIRTSDFTDDRGWQPVANDNTDLSVSIVFIPAGSDGKEYEHFDPDLSGGFVIGYLAGSASFIPSLKDRVIRADGTEWGVKFVDRVQPNAETILYRVGMMR